MGHLLFLLGSLDTKRQINKKSYELMNLSSRLRTLQSNISILKQIQSSAENAWTSIANTSSSLAQSVFNASVARINNSPEMEQALKDLKDPAKKDAAQATIDTLTAKANKETQVANGAYQAAIAGIGTGKQVMNSVFETSNKVQLEYYNNEETQIENEKEGLEAELEVLRQEYQNDKKARQEEAKNVAPSFGLG